MGTPRMHMFGSRSGRNASAAGRAGGGRRAVRTQSQRGRRHCVPVGRGGKISAAGGGSGRLGGRVCGWRGGAGGRGGSAEASRRQEGYDVDGQEGYGGQVASQQPVQPQVRTHACPPACPLSHPSPSCQRDKRHTPVMHTTFGVPRPRASASPPRPLLLTSPRAGPSLSSSSSSRPTL